VVKCKWAQHHFYFTEEVNNKIIKMDVSKVAVERLQEMLGKKMISNKINV
jgi:hypothetical protein